MTAKDHAYLYCWYRLIVVLVKSIPTVGHKICTLLCAYCAGGTFATPIAIKTDLQHNEYLTVYPKMFTLKHR